MISHARACRIYVFWVCIPVYFWCYPLFCCFAVVFPLLFIRHVDENIVMLQLFRFLYIRSSLKRNCAVKGHNNGTQLYKSQYSIYMTRKAMQLKYNWRIVLWCRDFHYEANHTFHFRIWKFHCLGVPELYNVANNGELALPWLWKMKCTMTNPRGLRLPTFIYIYLW